MNYQQEMLNECMYFCDNMYSVELPAKDYDYDNLEDIRLITRLTRNKFEREELD